MKKMYMKPMTERFSAHSTGMICASINKVYGLTRHAEWGDVDTYAPEKWVNEGHTTDPGNIGWPAVAVDEPGDYASRGKRSLWDDDDFD